ncbi:Oidioi.mRNA.OKI2018_I69.chr2.g7954.t1.cds [Oikopleura dioica]|uniref:Oidioi.mRNA.OKI2018_I69.chr2.g7954.t1.cds n=1 Tax=Oikopleura dioica TaxID=34765 RepID=A0ABN7T8C7_OIKDI|nr:Oidioi.mRNA.OKI2018_I69.chr2.g7954.t1.cds [Oikopleura dioica]
MATVSRWDISDCPFQPIIAETTRSKQVVSRSWPSGFGTVWACDYSIISPDNTKKILIEFQEILLIGKQNPEEGEGDPECTYHRLNIIDEKTKRDTGYYCGTDTPPSFLSDSNKIIVRFNSTDTPVGFYSKGYAFTFKAVADTYTLKPKIDPTQLQQQNMAMLYPEIFGYGSQQRFPIQNIQAQPAQVIPQYGQIAQPGLIAQQPQFGMGRNPDVEYLDPPPQYDNPFAINDYEYDYGQREYGGYVVSSRGVVPKQQEVQRKRRPKRIQSRPLGTPEPPAGMGSFLFGGSENVLDAEPEQKAWLPFGGREEPEWTGDDDKSTDLGFKEMWSANAVRRPSFMTLGISDGEQPYVDPKVEQIFRAELGEVNDASNTVAVKKFLGEDLFDAYSGLVDLLGVAAADPMKIVLIIGLIAGVIILICCGCTVHCCLRCRSRKIDNEAALALENLKRSKQQAAQLRAQKSQNFETLTHISCQSRCNSMKTYELPDYDDDPPSYCPDPNQRTVPIRASGEAREILAKTISSESRKSHLPVFKNEASPVLTKTKFISTESNKRPAPPVPLEPAQVDTSVKPEDTTTIGADHTISVVTLSEINSESLKSSSPENSEADDTVKSMSEATITNVSKLREKIVSAGASMSTIVTQKSLKIVDEIEKLEKQRKVDKKDQSVVNRIDQLQKELLTFME